MLKSEMRVPLKESSDRKGKLLGLLKTVRVSKVSGDDVINGAHLVEYRQDSNHWHPKATRTRQSSESRSSAKGSVRCCSDILPNHAYCNFTGNNMPYHVSRGNRRLFDEKDPSVASNVP